MNTHTLTTEQVRKFVDAVGGVCKQEIAGGQFTTNKLEELAESLGGLRDWPKHTDDPKVNYAVDCVVCSDDETPEYDEKLYLEEIEAFKALD